MELTERAKLRLYAEGAYGAVHGYGRNGCGRNMAKAHCRNNGRIEAEHAFISCNNCRCVHMRDNLHYERGGRRRRGGSARMRGDRHFCRGGKAERAYSLGIWGDGFAVLLHGAYRAGAFGGHCRIGRGRIVCRTQPACRIPVRHGGRSIQKHCAATVRRCGRVRNAERAYRGRKAVEAVQAYQVTYTLA